MCLQSGILIVSCSPNNESWNGTNTLAVDQSSVSAFLWINAECLLFWKLKGSSFGCDSWQNNHAGSKSNSHSKAHTHKHTHTHQSPRKDRIKKEWVHGFACRILALKNIVNWKWEPWTAKKMPKASMKQQGVYDKILHRPNILIAKNYIASINFH